MLEEVIAEHPVLLNRAPTLHRLGIQAFEPQLIEGKAIQLHPLVCAAFNADFDGDQMAVHLPLSAEAQAEARVLMLSTNNILKPADGRPVTVPSHEMIIGMYWLTMLQEGREGSGHAFSSVAEAIMAHDRGELHVGAPIKLRLTGIVPPAEYADKVRADGSVILETSLGRALFNEALPADFPFVNERVGKKQIGQIVNDLAERYPLIDTVRTLDGLKDLGFEWGSRSGVTVSIADVHDPADASPRSWPPTTPGRQDRHPVRAWFGHGGRAAPGADRALDRRNRGADGCDEGELLADQPDLRDGQLGCPWQHDADAPDRGHAGPGGQPEG